MSTQVGAMVASLAQARHMTVSELADETGIHRNRLSDKIKGKVAFTEADILRLAEVFGVAPGHLFNDPLELLGASSRCIEVPSGQRLLRAA